MSLLYESQTCDSFSRGWLYYQSIKRQNVIGMAQQVVDILILLKI